MGIWSKQRWLITSSTVIVVLATSLIVIFLIVQHGRNSVLPNSITSQLDFPIYYPQPMPTGYKLQRPTVRQENGVLFYDIASPSYSAQISEQPLPTAPPDLSSIPGFKKFETINGSGIIGASAGRTVAILQTNTTLITVTGSNGTPQDQISRIVTGMASL